MSERTDELSLLNEAIGFFRQCARFRASAIGLSNLADALLTSYERTGDLPALQEAIAVAREAAQLAATDPTVLSNLASGLRLIFERIGDRSAAIEALALLRRLEEVVAAGHPNASAVLLNAAVVTSELGLRLNQSDAVHEAVRLARRAVDAAPPGHRGRGVCLNGLGVQLTDLFQITRDPSILDEAIAALKESVDGVDSPQRGIALGNLARALEARARHFGQETDFEAAVAVYRRAVDLAEAPQVRAWAADLLGDALSEMLTRFDRRALLDEALAAYQVVLHVQTASPRRLLHAAWMRAKLLSDRERWKDALSEYTKAIRLIPKLSARQLSRSDKQYALVSVAGLACEAAASAINADTPEHAVELLEQGRGVIYAQTLDSRSDLTVLRAREPELAAQFEDVRDQLDSADVSIPPLELGMGVAAARHSGRSTPEARQNLELAWNDILTRIRRVDGFSRFLEPPAFADLAPAGDEGPVVLINLSSYRCDALLIISRTVHVVPLPDVDPAAVRRQAAVLIPELRLGNVDTPDDADPAKVIEWLGRNVLDPVMVRIAHAGPTPGDLPLRLWWCTTGLLGYLPIHAAVATVGSSSNIGTVISSYTPTLRSLIATRAERRVTSRDPASKALIVAMPTTPATKDGWQPYVDLMGASIEAMFLKQRLPNATLLMDPLPEYATVVAELPNYSLVHFACHADSDLDDPSQSHLVLADYEAQPLTVRDLSRLRTDNAELAFLSACGTAQTAPSLADEAVHITSAFQLAGFPQVVGTLWPIEDLPTVELVKEFYEAYLSGLASDPPLSAALALHRAVEGMRKSYPDPRVWASYVHVGC